MGSVDKCVLLYSGGLDSFILRQLAEFDKIVYFDVGTEDGKREMERLDSEVEIISLPLQRFELPNKIIPFRNYLFVLLAANFGNRVFIATTLGDTTRDKDYVFQGLSSSILNYFGGVEAKMPYKAEHFEVVMPFKDRTKAEIIRDYRRVLEPIHVLKQSRSCYASGEKECGVCRSCLRKYVAFANNDLAYLLDFSPPSQAVLVNLYEESVKKGRHERELQEIVNCYSKR